LAKNSTKKRIICTVINDLTYDQRMIRICTSLAKAGYEVLLVGRQLSNSKPIDNQLFKQKRLHCWFNKGIAFYIEYNIRLFFFLLFRKWDIINSIDLDTILPGYYVSKIKNKICIYDAHEYFTEVPEVVRRPKVKRIWEWVARKTIPNLEYCYTVGSGLAQIFEEQYGTPFEVIRNVPFQSKNTIPKKEKSIILYQGALNESRGLEQVIEAMDLINDAELWLAGEGDLSQQLRDLVQEKGLDNKVKFLGFIKPAQLKELTPKASIGLNLLENKGLSYYYSLANKAFDYIQCGVPALHMSFPEYKQINQQYEVSILLDDLEKETIADALQKLLLNKNLYNKLQANCALAAEEFIWEKEEEKLLEIYKAIFVNADFR